MKYSFIIPVYNRPEELDELLQSLQGQTFKEFEVIVIEDGSQIKSDEIVKQFENTLSIQYISQENTGQGFARNNGMHKAQSDFFIILDSDVVLPKDYLSHVDTAVESRGLDAFGGPDRSNEDFSDLQKAMDFAMTSFWTTGGIRGQLKDLSKFQARGFNMGVSRKVFEQTQGFVDPNRGEDIEWSMRIKKAGYKLELVPDAFVYHKRKSDLKGFINQAFSFGANRINVSRYHPEAVQIVHLLPLGFLLFLISIPITANKLPLVSQTSLGLLLIWSSGVLFDSYQRYKSLNVAIQSWYCSVSQLCAYGAGFFKEWVTKTCKG